MDAAIFLSAGVPDPRRGPQYAKTADSVAITAAVSALVYVVLGRRPLVWGGQPSITPMIWVVAQDFGVDYGRWVHLYQSEYFRDEFPEDNKRFQNVTYTRSVDEDLEKSLFEMRRRMFGEQEFSAAIFVGGMGGIIREYELFAELQPKASIIPVVSTGGATLEVGARLGELSADLSTDLDYVSLFHRHLGISVKEGRYRDPTEQPADLADRLWKAN